MSSARRKWVKFATVTAATLVFGAALADAPAAQATADEQAALADSTIKLDKPLNLRVPDIRKSHNEAELNVAMGLKANGTGLDVVEVESTRIGERPGPPNPPGGLAGLFWGVAHPLSLWRVFAPRPDQPATLRPNDQLRE